MRRLVLILLLLLPLSAPAQEPRPRAEAAVLVADQLYITPERVLVASGNVEAFQGTRRLRAQAIRYDQKNGALSIEGPIVLSDGADTVFLADAAELDPALRDGILTGARLVLNQQLQLAAQQINRVEGRYSQLYKTAVTSCRVCDDGRPPLWQIRAKRVVHDALERQLYFDQAQFRIGTIPVFYLPRLRLPDPTVTRTTGFLVPSVRTTSQLGVGVKVPYFITLGDHRDLTLTPYLSSSTTTLEYRYRQAFVNGRIQFDGAITRDDERPGETRGYLFGFGRFDLPRDYVLDFRIEATGDDAYLRDYGYSDADRLRSEVGVSRARRDKFTRATITNFKSQREGEVNATLPTLVLDGEHERRLFPTRIGGELRLGVQAHSHTRRSTLAVDGPDADSIVDGRDVARIGGSVEWLRGGTLGFGLRADLRLGASFDAFNVAQDAGFPGSQSQVTPHAALTLRYPLLRRGDAGVAQLLEPVVQLGWSGGERLNLPNEESTRVEFDQGNLLAMSRFPQPDRRERGTVGVLGVNWARFDPNGWDSYVTVAQVFRDAADPAFSTTSGLSGSTSDFLIAGQLKSADGLALTARGLLNEQLNVSKAELRGDWAFARGRLGGSYVWLIEDPAEDRDREFSEITFDGSLAINRFWTASADWRYDVASDNVATAGIGLSYQNECVNLDLRVDRRYTTSTSVEPSTNIGFNVALRGFSASKGTERYVRSCSN